MKPTEFKVPPERIIEEPAYECAECRDSGWIVKPDGGAGCVKRCRCSRPDKNPKLLRQMLKLAGMRDGEVRACYDPWDETYQPRPEWAREWLFWAMGGCHDDAAPEFISAREPVNPRLLTLLGPPGRAKTKTAGVLLRHYVRNGGCGAIWIRIPDEEGFDRVQRQRQEHGHSEFEKTITAAPLVVLDELGALHRGAAVSETLAATVSEWISRRERRSVLTIVTTNAEKFSDLKDARLESRLASGVYRLMQGPDYRDRCSATF